MKAYSLNRSINKEISKVVDLFLEDVIQSFEMKLNIELSNQEFETLIGKPDSSAGVIENGISVDEYVYDVSDKVLKKLIVEYIQPEEGRVILLSIQGFTDFVR